MDEVYIAEHALKHGVAPQDIEHAWANFVRKQYRGSPNEGEIVVIGIDTNGNLLQLVAAERLRGIVIFHAMRPPTQKVLKELGLYWR